MLVVFDANVTHVHINTQNTHDCCGTKCAVRCLLRPEVRQNDVACREDGEEKETDVDAEKADSVDPLNAEPEDEDDEDERECQTEHEEPDQHQTDARHGQLNMSTTNHKLSTYYDIKKDCWLRFNISAIISGY